MKIITKRDYKNHHTDGEVFIDESGERFCYSLEDIGRPIGIKIPGDTCIPEGVYSVGITRSYRWDKDMLILFNNDTDCSIDSCGIRYTGIRPHGGNSIKDTHGCPLLGHKTDLAGSIWNRASDDLFDLVKAAIDAGECVTWEFTRV